MTRRRRVLFVCTHNSSRSQMAEGFLRALAGDRFDVASAGTAATRVHPFAIRAMAEAGIDISLHESKTVDRFLAQRFDLVVTVCDDAAEACPVFPNAAERRHWPFPDPTRAAGGEGPLYAAFVAVRDAIRTRVENELLGARPVSGG